MSTETLEERRQHALATLEQRRAEQAHVMAISNQNNYLANPELKEFNKQVRDMGLKQIKKSRKLGTVEQTEKNIRDYFDLCEEYNQLPSIKTMCLYLGISISTYKSYMADLDSEYSELFRAGIDYIHSVIENGALNNKINPATYMFTATNFYGMNDTKRVDVATVLPQNNSMSGRDSINALREELQKEKEESVKEAVYTEKES